jgi:uncharacterized protein
MANPFVHVELHSNDLKKARDFFTNLFGWKLEDMPMPGMGTYTMIGVGEGTGGGMMVNEEKGTPSHWLAYVGVDDINASTKQAKQLGAKIMLDVTPVADMGFMSIIADPSGAALGLWQSKTKG